MKPVQTLDIQLVIRALSWTAILTGEALLGVLQ